MPGKTSQEVQGLFESITSERTQYLVFLALSLGVILFTSILYFTNRFVFQRFLGKVNPLLAFLLAIVLGLLLFSILISQGWFAIYKKENLGALRYAAAIASMLGVVMILADTRIVFSEDTNILFPQSLLFYPAIGFFAEILFHVLPLTILLILLRSIFNQVNFQTLVWVCILLVCLIESIFQSANMISQNRFPLWAVIFVGVHVYLISLFQLYFFKRYDFIAMYFFRLIYYLFWHIAWGYFRLSLLF